MLLLATSPVPVTVGTRIIPFERPKRDPGPGAKASARAVLNPRAWTVTPLRDLVGPTLYLHETRRPRPRIEDADMEALARAWSQLEHFSLGSPFSSNYDLVWVHALHSVHAHRRNLNTLEVGKIRCSAVSVHLIPASLGDRPSPPLRSLTVQSCWPSDAVESATRLRRLWPGICSSFSRESIASGSRAQARRASRCSVVKEFLCGTLSVGHWW